jgi:hypothetical protein
MSDDNLRRTLTFNDTASFHHWLKRQKKTTFSVPVLLSNSSLPCNYIQVTKRALGRLTIGDKEVIKVDISVGQYTGKNYAYVEPERVRGDNK